MDLIVAFMTGLTAGGLSCLAVQGGLLASTLGHQMELELQAQSGVVSGHKFRPHIAQPILIFLIAKVISYTLFGVLLGLLGSVLQLTPLTGAILLIVIGIFMVGNGLRMLKIHPIFRYFVIEPPSALTRYIRRKSKNGDSFFTPIFMGALTVFLPCGIAQSMMAAALATGNPWQGAAIMFAFTIGTTPVFFSIAYFATRLGATIEKYFMRIVAVVVIILGLVTIENGLVLSGSPITAGRVFNKLFPQSAAIDSAVFDGKYKGGYGVLIYDDGYAPNVLHLPAEKPVTLHWVTEGTKSCALAVVVPPLNYYKIMPNVGDTPMEIPPQKRGTVIDYSCSMGMSFGQWIFDLD